ncbi:ATP phosphoribosyltransferase [Maridesulfovibrio hydrothermalis]|uniref:ATP phosphoribosyltransferase n=1 Tax=Maridesulfovibrio hydrothermalis AM13 = DSM 14728 TaxID=1121451 RepID=L0R8H0_9BACT|nr:ATP phosphoribosyltransferase [Maridesulfovibrio hydrothermalis]CCO23058.1 ATP phosphoribosyltransferase [Maridesulfovibrio hydrothermalis AM13 = DSM 14728]
MSNTLKIGLPKGSLQDATIKLFAKSGWKINLHHRNYFPDVNDEELTISMCRAQEMAKYVEDGVLDVGMTGKDWILENNSDVVEVSSLVYSKVSNRPARWVLAVSGDSPYEKPEDLAGKKIATELLGVTKRYFEEKGIDVEVFYSWGATEAKVVEGLCDAIVEVTETGTTIKAHGLKIIDDVMLTNTRLIANKDSWNDSWKRKKIENINLLLQGALKAEKMVGLKMNMPKDVLEKAMKVMPSLNSPTVSDLSDPKWVSVEIMIEEVAVRELIPELIDMGAEGIIEYPLNKVI